MAGIKKKKERKESKAKGWGGKSLDQRKMNWCEDAMETAGRSDECDQRFTDAVCGKGGKIIKKHQRKTVDFSWNHKIKTHSKWCYEGRPL